MLHTSTKGAKYINMGRKPYGIGMEKILALKERPKKHRTIYVASLALYFGMIRNIWKRLF